MLGCAAAGAVLVLTRLPVVDRRARVPVALVFATPFRHVDYAAYVTMYSVFFIAAVSLTSADLASELSVVRVADTLVGVGCSLLVLRYSMTEPEHRRPASRRVEYASRPRGEYAPLAVFAEGADRDPTVASELDEIADGLGEAPFTDYADDGGDEAGARGRYRA